MDQFYSFIYEVKGQLGILWGHKSIGNLQIFNVFLLSRYSIPSLFFINAWKFNFGENYTFILTLAIQISGDYAFSKVLPHGSQRRSLKEIIILITMSRILPFFTMNLWLKYIEQ